MTFLKKKTAPQALVEIMNAWNKELDKINDKTSYFSTSSSHDMVERKDCINRLNVKLQDLLKKCPEKWENKQEQEEYAKNVIHLFQKEIKAEITQNKNDVIDKHLVHENKFLAMFDKFINNTLGRIMKTSSRELIDKVQNIKTGLKDIREESISPSQEDSLYNSESDDESDEERTIGFSS